MWHLDLPLYAQTQNSLTATLIFRYKRIIGYLATIHRDVADACNLATESGR